LFFRRFKFFFGPAPRAESFFSRFAFGLRRFCVNFVAAFGNIGEN
jgi:hypothetical protein